MFSYCLQYWTSFCLGNLSVPNTPCMRFLFVKPRFCPWVSILPTSDFLQIPSFGGHPCLRLTVPTAKSVADFHRQVIAHAERTSKKRACAARRKPAVLLISLPTRSVFESTYGVQSVWQYARPFRLPTSGGCRPQTRWRKQR